MKDRNSSDTFRYEMVYCVNVLSESVLKKSPTNMNIFTATKIFNIARMSIRKLKPYIIGYFKELKWGKCLSFLFRLILGKCNCH